MAVGNKSKLMEHMKNSHSEEQQESEDSESMQSDFQDASPKHHPPDFLERVITMMEKVMKEVEELKMSVKKQQ